MDATCIVTTHKPMLIGLYSPVPAQGKSTIASHLSYAHGFLIVKYANPLKGMVKDLLRSVGMDWEEVCRRIEGDMKEEPIPALGGRSARYLMQTLGTEWGRELVHPNVWVEVTRSQITEWLDLGFSVVVDDMRFPNEYDLIKELGGYTIRVARPYSLSDIRLSSSEGKLNGHPFDMGLYNGGSISDLHTKVDAGLNFLKSQQKQLVSTFDHTPPSLGQI